jgi:hypothetical protein
MWRKWLVGLVLMLGSSMNAFAQQDAPSSAASNRRVAESQRREWLRNQITKLLPDSEQRTEILGRLNGLSDDQVQALASVCLDELEARRKQQLLALREANAREREANARERAFREELARRFAAAPGFHGQQWFFENPGYYAPAVGYIPVITWLPEGVSLTTQAVVSPDRRHVRLSVVPFFSTIGPVYTFNYMTGETRRYDP